MILLSVGGFLFEMYQTLVFEITNLTTTATIVLGLMVASIITWWIYCFIVKKRSGIAYYRLALAIGACGWFLLPKGIWLGVIYLIAALLEKPIKVQPEIGFDNEEIAFNTFPTKRIAWQEVNNVVLKDGLLTIDLKSNKLIQKEVCEVISKSTEEEFNTFCVEQIRQEAPNKIQ